MEHREPTRRARDVSVSRAVLQFALAGLAAVALFALVSLLVLRELGRREAIRNAEQFAVLAGQGIVEPALDDGLLTGDGAARARIDRLVQERVLSDRVVRVKIWSRDGRIVYSDEPRLVGSTYPLGKDELAVLRSGATEAELSDLSKPENRFDRGQGSLYEVYTRVRTPSGTPLMFEMYQRSSSLVSRGREIWLPFAAALLAGLLLLWAVQVPLAWRLARRLQRSQAEREALLVHAVEASADERRRVAADLHDGVVQDLAGVSYSLSAAADRAAGHDSPEAVGALRSGAASLRGAVRQLRTLLVAIHPPNLQSAGLRAALTDLLAPLEADGVAIELDVPDELDLSADEERLLFRAAAEALRNVRRHARASRVSVRITLPPGRVVLAIEDDGACFDRDERERRRAEGHMGLSLLAELAERQGGTLDVRSEPGSGTVLSMELPPPVIRLLIADDHAVVRTGLAQLASGFDDVELLGAAANGEEAVAMCAETSPDVVLMDLEMPVLDGIEATRRIKAAQPEIAVVVLTSFSDRERILGALDAGAAGYLLKDAEPDELARAIRAAAGGDVPLDPKAARALLSARTTVSPADSLSEREREVLLMVAEGLPNKLIARRLEISEKTVKAHLTSVFRRIGVTDRTQAALWAERNGLTRGS